MEHKLSVEEICQKLKPVFGSRIDNIYLRYAMSESREEKEEIEHVLNALYHKHLSELLGKGILLEPPSQKDMQGEYPLAVVSYAGKRLHKFALREHDFVRHVCISGMSGSGKTTLALHITKSFIEKNKPFIIFDWKKSFRPLMMLDSSIICFTVGNELISNFLKININKPPRNVSPKEWLNVLCDLITESFFASYGVHKILLETLDEAFEENGIYNGSERYPTWFEIKRRLEEKEQKKKGREASWLMSALRIAHILTFGSFGKAINYKGKDALTIEELLGKKVIFELNALGNIEKKFFCEFILTYIYKLKKINQTGINENFDQAIVVDEAHNIFLKEKTNFAKESVTDMIYREMREYGIGLICLDQHISKISDTAVGNSACHIAFQQQLPQDIECVAGLMQLKDRKQFFSMLPVGSAIVKLSERYTQPFLVEVPPSQLRSEAISDENVSKRMKHYMTWTGLQKGNDPEFLHAHVNGGAEGSIGNEADEHPIKIEQEIENIITERQDMEQVKEQIEEHIEEQEKTINQPQEIFRPVSLMPMTLSQIGEIAHSIGISTGIEKSMQAVSEAAPASISPVPSAAVNILTPVQQILYEYVQKKLQQGASLKYIENVLERNAKAQGYKTEDVYKAVNYALENMFRKGKSIELTDNQNVLHEFIQSELEKGRHIETIKYMLKDFVEERGFYTQEDIEKAIEHAIENDIKLVPEEGKTGYADSANTDDEKGFIKFLQANHNKELSTTEIYNALGLSARKGNEIKNRLLSKGIIRIDEIKSSKGWRKAIRLAQA